MKTDAIILAGGKGTRLRSVFPDIPKPLVLINGRPFLDILLSQLSKFSCIEKVVLAVGYKAEMITGRYKDCSTYNFKILFSEEEKLLGTGGAIKKSLPLIDTDDALILNGDSYVEIDIYDLIRFHETKNALITIVLKQVDNAERYGSVAIDNQMKILHFEEKQNKNKHGLINAGMYIANKALFDRIEKEREMSFEKEILPEFIKNNAYGYVVSGKFIDIGIPETYKIAGGELKEIF